MKVYPKIKHKGKLISVTSHPLFPVYHGIKNRCYNKNFPTYDRWGGRGIKMSKSWYLSFERFVQDIGPRPSKNHSVDRIDNNKGYNKNNCRWATAKEQSNNQRSNIKINYKGKVKTLAQISEEINIPYRSLYHYFVVKGISEIDLIIGLVKHKKGRRITHKELKEIRKVQHLIQDEMCPILKLHFKEKDMVVDHAHSKHSKFSTQDNAGLIRGVIHRQANSFEGKLANLMVRLGMHKFDLSLPELLRNTADYLEQPPLPYIHPSECPRKPILTKTSYNKLRRAYKGKAKFPEYKTRRKGKIVKNVQGLTKPLEKLFNEYEIEPEFYK